MNNKKKWKTLAIYLAIPIIAILAITFFFNMRPVEQYSYSEIVYYFEDEQVKEFSVNAGSGDLRMVLQDGKRINTKIASVSLFYEDVKEYIDKYNQGKPENQRLKFDIARASDNSFINELMMIVIMVLIFGVFWYFMMRRMSGGGVGKEMSFGKAKFKNANDEKRKTTFADVAGADEEKAELEEIVQFLKDSEKYKRLGAKIPKGVLLVGPPGTGKTLLARAVAGEAGVPFFSISGSDFVEMFVGVGASRVRDLFETAKKNAPCIVFIDEIDAVGRQRGTGLGGGNDEREQTLNQLLVEMDGFGANAGVIIMAATNRPDVLDPALMRPGRFDRQVVVSYPDINGREAILKVHSREKPLAPDVDLNTVARSTAGFTGADLENLLNEAALLAARDNKKAITMNEIDKATIKVVVGTEKKSRVINEKEKRLTAYHEAGHAVAHYYCETQDKVHQISIIPTGFAGGYTMPIPSEEKMYHTKLYMEEEIVTLLGGRVAEEITLGDISTGASNDIERATKTARDMVTKYGFSAQLGTVCYGSSNNEVFIGRDMGQVKDYSDETAAKIDSEIQRIVAQAYAACKKILTEHNDKLRDVAEFLISHEKMTGSEFEAVMKSNDDPGDEV